MEQKKNPQADLERSRSIFTLIGLIVALGVVIFLFEWKTYERELMDLGSLDMEIDEEMVPVTLRQKKPPPPPPPPPEVIQVVEDDKEIEDEIKIQDQDFDEEEIIEIIEEPEEEEVLEPMNFMVVENKPVFPGCENLKDANEQDMCFNQKINEHILTVFKYPPIARDMGIQGKVFVTFVIDQQGKITNATVGRGVDKHLDAEAVRIVNTLPQMTPAKQRGKSVPVAFTVPINFKLQ
ncbi:MAG: TonB family protein [Flavobacteriales bacterium]|nr:TonB family protein [Flavobacteriales bacterium]